MAEAESGPDGLVIRFEEVEVALLRSLAGQLLDFVSPAADDDEDPLVALVGIDPAATTPDDPALRRLFPDAYADDDAASAQFRRFTERDLRAAKAHNAQAVLATLSAGDGSVLFDAERAKQWTGFINDTRLTIGSRLDVQEDNHDELDALPDDDPRAALYQVYDWLTFVQETLVQWLLGARP